MASTPPNAVQFTGAKKGDVLIGLEGWRLNRGLLLRVHSDQQKNRDKGGAITDGFDLLTAGDGMYSEYLREFVGQSFKKTSDLIQEIRDRGAKNCTYILNCECLTLTSDTVTTTLIPEEVPDPDVLYEGAVQQIKVNAYERNLKAREQCINHYRSRCVCCDFEFSGVYGEIGEGLIHVHHLEPISSVGKRYKVDPIRDLRPVCPNCHAIIHRRNPPLTVEEVKTRIRGNNSRREK